MIDQRSPNNEQDSLNEGLDDAADYRNKLREILQREATRPGQKQESIDSMSTVNLNVGGYCFKTGVQTLTKYPNTKLAAMLKKPCEGGAYVFIDRDGTHFRFILNCLRTGKLILPEGATFLKEFLEEAEFYRIQGIIDELKASEPTVQASKHAKPFEESVLLTNENHQSVLKNWLPSQEGKWRLLFRASRDGFAAAAFHSKCDNKGPTVTIVKSGNNIFGGFAEESWTTPPFGQGWKLCRDAFLFSMVNPYGLGPTKMPVKTEQNQYAIYDCDSDSGPRFGGGIDLYIGNYSNTNTSSYSVLGDTYELPPGHVQQGSFTVTGSHFFTVTDYEVFGLHK